ncbi:ABC transporter permease [Curtobacterium ammoniigenes]|uniref:ABC transporter permease n=1 Tax=Curtobacterium ammoniigenes TaxID=395387 RepID=UPI00082B22AD|nr:ABC transporter permease [Curtobacterium ammoniigenes]
MTLLRDFVSTLVVAALGSAFGSAMLIASALLGDYAVASGLQRFTSLIAVLDIVGLVFLGIALYVSGVVTANTCATVIAGRSRLIALERLIGASSARLRSTITRSGLLVGALGAIAGTAFAVLSGAIVLAALRNAGVFPPGHYTLIPTTLILPGAGVVLTTWLAFRVGSRRVLEVRPIEALAGESRSARTDRRASRGRAVAALLAVIAGTALLAMGVLGYSAGPEMVFVAMLGGFVSFTGVVVGAPFFLPPVLGVVGRLGASSPTVLLAGRNAVREPARAARATVGLVIGVTLLVTFSTALATYEHQIVGQFDLPKATLVATHRAFATMDAIAGGLAGFSAVIAAIGVINVLALGILQRQREVALLRAIGLTGAQVRGMVVIESLQMVATALLVGVVLGTVYGWAGAVALFGYKTTGAPIVPVLPPTTLGIVAVGGGLLAVLASIAPLRRVTRVPPTEALAVE